MKRGEEVSRMIENYESKIAGRNGSNGSFKSNNLIHVPIEKLLGKTIHRRTESVGRLPEARKI